MKWEGRERSSNVEDRRGLKTGAVVGGGGALILVILAMVLGVDPRQFLGERAGGQQAVDQPRSPEEEKQYEFTTVVLRDTEIVWTELFKQKRLDYKIPTLVVFTNQVDSACGMADAAVGPFYCPGDSKIYIDLSFYTTLDQELGAPGEFARAYVIAHEVGHHVQRLLGYSARVDEARQTQPKRVYNQMSVRLELQADYLAGVWAHHAQKKFQFLEKGDLESAHNAAFRIGDDVLQKKARGRVTPDSFTHGTAKQRQRWFMEGFNSGNLDRARLLFELRYEEL
jgi:predicted metalloprotease